MAVVIVIVEVERKRRCVVHSIQAACKKQIAGAATSKHMQGCYHIYVIFDSNFPDSGSGNGVVAGAAHAEQRASSSGGRTSGRGIF